MALAFAYCTQATSTTDAAGYTFSSLDITAGGSENATRRVVVGVVGEVASANQPNTAPSSVTIGGVTATLVDSGISVEIFAGIYEAVVPTGTSISVVVTFAETQVLAGIGVWVVQGTAAGASDHDKATGTGASISLSTVTVPADGCGIWIFGNDNNGAVTWTNASESFDVQPGAEFHRISGADTATAGTPTVTADGSTGAQVIVGAAWVGGGGSILRQMMQHAA